MIIPCGIDETSSRQGLIESLKKLSHKLIQL